MNRPVHLIFAADTKGINEALALQNTKDFFKDLANHFKFPRSGITHGFLEYNPSGEAQVSFVQFDRRSKMPAYIDLLQSTRKTSSLDRAMREAAPGLLNHLDYDSRLQTPYAKVNMPYKCMVWKSG